MQTKKRIIPWLFPSDTRKRPGIIIDFFESFSELIFCSGYLPGIFFVILCSICDLNVTGAAIVSMISLQIFIKIVGINWGKYRAAYMIYNPILVGMSIGVIFRLSASVVLVISIATILTFLLTISMAELFRTMGIPILSLPFAIVSTAFYLASTSYSKLFSLAYYDNKIFADYEVYLPEVVAAFFKAFGTIIFMPNILVGGVIFFVILFRSRILAFHTIAAFAVGVFIHSLMISSFEQSLNNPYNFNFILVGLALGGVFLLTSLRASLICLLAVGVSVILIDVTGGIAELFRIPVFTLPFNFSVILFLYALRAVGYSEINNDIRLTPEDSLSANKIFKQRFHPEEISIGLPVDGSLTVYQAQNGSWTHQEKWRYAYDFVIQDKDGNMSCSNESLENNYIFGKDIISPVAGFVVTCCDTFPDNPIGKVDHFNNWGNYIILRTAGEWFVEISHLMQGSIRVRTGDYIELGQVLGKCGNSGFSPVPHVHVQVQKTGLLGDETIPFNLAIYQKGNQVYCAGKPTQNDLVEPLSYDDNIAKSLNLNLATMHKFNLIRDGEIIDSVTFQIKRNTEAGAVLFLEDQRGAKLYFTYGNGSFYFYDFIGNANSLLKMLFIAMPRLPLIHKDSFCWKDSLPPILTGNWLEREMFALKAWFNPNVKCVKGTWEYKHGSISGRIRNGSKEIRTLLNINPIKGIEKIKVGNLELKRIS